MEAQKVTTFLRKWRGLVKRAENGSRMEKKAERHIVVEMTVAEVLAVGDFFFGFDDAIIVKDTENKIWIVPETHEKGGLVNRHIVKPGMKIKLVITEIIYTEKETKAFTQ